MKSSMDLLEAISPEVDVKVIDKAPYYSEIPENELTPAVQKAMQSMLEKINDMQQEITDLHDRLSDVTQLAEIDCLVPIPNRRAFMRHLSWAIAMHERYGDQSVMLFIDLNDFKQINDNYGHSNGDAAILHVANVLESMMRESDFIARIGGDEFGIVMFHADEKSALKRGKKIVESLSRKAFNCDGKPVLISAALGCHAIVEGDTAESVLKAADEAMYKNKRKEKRA